MEGHVLNGKHFISWTRRYVIRYFSFNMLQGELKTYDEYYFQGVRVSPLFGFRVILAFVDGEGGRVFLYFRSGGEFSKRWFLRGKFY